MLKKIWTGKYPLYTKETGVFWGQAYHCSGMKRTEIRNSGTQSRAHSCTLWTPAIWLAWVWQAGQPSSKSTVVRIITWNVLPSHLLDVQPWGSTHMNLRPWVNLQMCDLHSVGRRYGLVLSDFSSTRWAAAVDVAWGAVSPASHDYKGWEQSRGAYVKEE